MSKSIKAKVIAALMCAVLVAVSMPLSLSVQATSPPPITTPAFTMARVDRTTVEAGQSVTLMLRTVNATQVTVRVNDVVQQATQGDFIPATGEQNWSISFTPNDTQIVPVHARAAHTDNAAEVSIPITVTGAVAPAPEQPAAPPAVPGQHVIHEVAEIQATGRNVVTLQVITDDGVNYVWVGPLGPDQFARGERQSSADGRSTWTVTYRPPGNARHEVTVAANAEFVLDHRMASQTYDVRLRHPYVPPERPADAGIQRISANPTTIRPGQQAALTVRTGRDVAYVWAMVDGRRVNARRDNLHSWTVNVRPERTQNITVYANTENDAAGAATDTIRLEVREVANVRITDVTPSQTNNLIIGQSISIEVITNLEAEYVWAVAGGATVRAVRRETRTNSIVWEIRNVMPPGVGTNTIDIYANIENRVTDDAHRQRVTVTVL